jgi:hypothetical protein
MDIEYFVPGNGPVVQKDFVTELRIYSEELIEKLTELKKEGLELKQIIDHPDLPEYPGKKRESWIEGSDYHTGFVNKTIEWWLRQIRIEMTEGDCIFISE